MLVPMVPPKFFGDGLAGILSALHPQRNRAPDAALAPRIASGTRETQQKSPLTGGFWKSHDSQGQCASAQTFFLVKYINPANTIRKIKTSSPNCLRASMCGSAAHIRNVAMSLVYCSSVVGDPSSNVT